MRDVIHLSDDLFVACHVSHGVEDSYQAEVAPPDHHQILVLLSQFCALLCSLDCIFQVILFDQYFAPNRQ